MRWESCPVALSSWRVLFCWMRGRLTRVCELYVTVTQPVWGLLRDTMRAAPRHRQKAVRVFQSPPLVSWHGLECRRMPRTGSQLLLKHTVC